MYLGDGIRPFCLIIELLRVQYFDPDFLINGIVEDAAF
jgi:hypothetical protein